MWVYQERSGSCPNDSIRVFHAYFRWTTTTAILVAALFCANTAKAGQSADSGQSQNTLPPAPQSSEVKSAARIVGTVVDPSGTAVGGAKVTLSRENGEATQETQTGADGQFVFGGVAPGTFRLAIQAPGFATQEFSGTLHDGQNFSVPPVALALAEVTTEVKVTPPRVEVAEEQLREEEQQRAFGFIPNFYVTYIPNAVPLTPKQKFKLAAKDLIDPVTFAVTGAVAGLQQANNDFSGYGQGAQGYGKRYGAAYADAAISTMIGGAILPSLFKQDPRYFYKGTGSKKSRLMYAIANAVICKGDNGRWQPNYSGLLGGFAAGGISNLYYPAKDRDAGLTFQNAAIGIGAGAATNILQEFVIKRFTPSVAHRDPANAGSPSGKPHNPVSRAFAAFVPEGD